MFEGGISFNHESDRAIRLIALGTPVFAGYNLLVYFSIVHSSNYVNGTVCLMISAAWIIVGMLHYFMRIHSRLDMMLRIVLYHILSLGTILFITGFLEPFASSIALLFLAANIYFGRRGLTLSVLSVILAAALDIAIRYPSYHAILFEDLMGASAILILGGAMVMVINAQETRRQLLISSQAQERLQHNRVVTIINNLTDATISVDKSGIIRLYNAASLSLFDTNDSLNGMHIDDLAKLIDAKDGKKISLFALLQSTKVTLRRDDLNYTYKDGEVIRLEVTYAPIRSTYVRHKKAELSDGYIIIMRDVTKAKSLEEERDEFISVVSHELRTPLTIAEGSLSNVQMMMEHPDITHAMLKDTVDVAHEQIVFLSHMVNDLSTLSRAERGVADNAELIDIRELAHKLLTEYEKEATKKNLHLNLDMSPVLGQLQTSRLYLEELLQNFVTNSIKYTKEGSVTISVKQKAGIVTFTVKDTGIGISKSDQAKIFQKFYRSEDYRTRETGGTGLGLYVAAKLAHKIGTKIKVTSRLNHGSSFSISMHVVTKRVK